MRSREIMTTGRLQSEKPIAGRTGAVDTPAFIRAVGVQVGADDRAYVRGKLDRKLGKFARHIARTSVRIEDVNGPRGGVDKRCRIKVVLIGLPSIVVEERHDSLQAAIDGALARVERAVRQAANSRRMKTRRRRVRDEEAGQSIDSRMRATRMAPRHFVPPFSADQTADST